MISMMIDTLFSSGLIAVALCLFWLVGFADRRRPGTAEPRTAAMIITAMIFAATTAIQLAHHEWFRAACFGLSALIWFYIGRRDHIRFKRSLDAD